MPEKRWKAQERRVAKLLGAKRNPHGDKDKPDAESTWLCIENKDRKELPVWLMHALSQAKARRKPNQLAIVTLTTCENPQVLVVMDLRDFRAWFGS